MRHLLTLVFFGWLCWIIYLADTAQPFDGLEWVRRFPGMDKVGHFCLFGGLAWLVNRSLGFRRWQLGSIALPLGAVLTLVFAIGEEITQLYFPNRQFDWIDLLADGCGVAAFSAVQLRWRRHNHGES